MYLLDAIQVDSVNAMLIYKEMWENEQSSAQLYTVKKGPQCETTERLARVNQFKPEVPRLSTAILISNLEVSSNVVWRSGLSNSEEALYSVSKWLSRNSSSSLSCQNPSKTVGNDKVDKMLKGDLAKLTLTEWALPIVSVPMTAVYNFALIIANSKMFL